ncbi:MAG: hypothetical protein ACXVEI_04815 [Actinomycetota bacterium]
MEVPVRALIVTIVFAAVPAWASPVNISELADRDEQDGQPRVHPNSFRGGYPN